MDKKLKQLFVALGSLVEIWVFVHARFEALGMDNTKALEHTKLFIESVITKGICDFIPKNKENDNVSDNDV